MVVRNHKQGERWGAEERDLKGPFPFALGSPFEVSGRSRNQIRVVGLNVLCEEALCCVSHWRASEQSGALSHSTKQSEGHF